jgi:hypothetical protein
MIRTFAEQSPERKGQMSGQARSRAEGNRAERRSLRAICANKSK